MADNKNETEYIKLKVVGQSWNPQRITDKMADNTDETKYHRQNDR